MGVIAWKNNEGEYVPFDIINKMQPWMVTHFFHLDISKYVVKKPIWNKPMFVPKEDLHHILMSINMNHFKKRGLQCERLNSWRNSQKCDLNIYSYLE